MVMPSNPEPTFFFIFQLEHVLRSNLKFSTYQLLVSFIWLGEKKSLKYLHIGGGTYGLKTCCKKLSFTQPQISVEQFKLNKEIFNKY